MKKSFLISFSLLTALASSVSAQIIYSDTFNRGTPAATAALDGSTPTTDTAGANWTANSTWTTNGTSADTDTGNAFLPLTIAPGHTYTVSANLTATTGDWVALGFAQNDGHLGDWIQNGTNAGPWLLVRSSGNGTQEFAGPDVNNGTGNSGAGVEGALYSITLDTTSPGYVATFSEAGTVLATYTYPVANDPADLYVGFGTHDTSDVTVSNFVVTDVVPEPSAWALMLLSIGTLFFVRRIRRSAI